MRTARLLLPIALLVACSDDGGGGGGGGAGEECAECMEEKCQDLIDACDAD